ncbi:MAG TPA: hypothetical protein VKT77_14920 [Chthonomonadaceae bacterium]|nr:hypothetical protein [Chthonomonadaceae bacterium]
MGVPVIELEGTWEEISRQLPDFDGKRLHVSVRLAEDSAVEGADSVDAALARIWNEVPDASWESLPADFGDNLDHYLYGSAKRQ